MSKLSGWTLIECLIGFAMMAVVFCCCVPIQSTLLAKNRIQMVGNTIIQAVRYARIESVIRGANLRLVPLENETDWSNGMRLLASDKKQVRVWHWALPGGHVVWKGFQSKQYLRFAADVIHGATNGSFVIQSNANASTSQLTLVVNRLGDIRIKQ